ncbi:hypothetical protein VIGAN_03000400 [Vigna angularis var. angularis]|uniref:Uncharacterized protein n=1 Tax=Vigna angularis var. angularis TaxID=157739 RepID=A0A0S3RIG3_PHAAN|nr:hypothetical protein VIGAN_03000400 [Vigna angularis var. angularis]
MGGKNNYTGLSRTKTKKTREKGKPGPEGRGGKFDTNEKRLQVAQLIASDRKIEDFFVLLGDQIVHRRSRLMIDI